MIRIPNQFAFQISTESDQYQDVVRYSDGDSYFAAFSATSSNRSPSQQPEVTRSPEGTTRRRKMAQSSGRLDRFV